MPRAKTARVLTFASGPGPDALGELTASIDALLTVANEQGVDTPRTKVLVYLLTALSHGEHIHPPWTWRLDVAVAFNNLASIVLSGRWQLRRCPQCGRWFIARNRRRQLCYRASCAHAATRVRARRAREHERAQQAYARTRTGTKQPR